MEDPGPDSHGTPTTVAGLTRSRLSRRTVVLGVSAVGATGLLSACGGSSDGDSTATGGDSSAPAASASSSASASDDSGGGGADDSGGADALAKTSDVPVAGGFVNKDAKVVVTQAAAGGFKAFSAICTHQGCTVAGVQDNVIQCPCHGSQFNAADGSVKQGPATTPLAEVPVKVVGGAIVKA